MLYNDPEKPQRLLDARSEQIHVIKATHKGESSLYAWNRAYSNGAMALKEAHASTHALAQRENNG